MANAACRVPKSFDGLAQAARLGGGRDLGQYLVCLHPRARREVRTQMGRNLHGRLVCAGKKRGPDVGKTKRGKGTKLMVLASQEGLPVGVTVHSASPHESTLAQESFEHSLAPSYKIERLIADKAYDSDALRRYFDLRGIELVCPHRSNRKRQKIQDGRSLRRYKKRWKVERIFSWLQEYRRCLVRWEWYPHLYRAFVVIAFIMMLVKRF